MRSALAGLAVLTTLGLTSVGNRMAFALIVSALLFAVEITPGTPLSVAAPAQASACQVKDFLGWIQLGEVVTAGDLKVRINSLPSSRSEMIVDLKAPNFLQTGVALPAEQQTKFSICNSEVTLTFHPWISPNREGWNELRVAVF